MKEVMKGDQKDTTVQEKRKESASVEVTIRDRQGLIHPIEEIQKTLQNLRKQRIRIVQLPSSDKNRTALLNTIDAAIAARESLLRQALNGQG